ncbi:hypothetical protein C8R43DRAFT_1202244 [Mycena crocata]|nr:hypothetical protein C8R43DRAFT_1202244 [Mycena crocata]
MPEAQVLHAFAHQIRLSLDEAYVTAGGLWPDGHLKLFPHTFAEGTAAKSHKTITVDVGDYDTSLEPTTDSFEINPHDAKRIPSGAPWKYLTDRPLKLGPVHVAHALVCHFTLEGNMKILKRADFNEMVSTCVKPLRNGDDVIGSGGSYYMGGVNNGEGLNVEQSAQLNQMVDKDEPRIGNDDDDDNEIFAWFSDEEDAGGSDTPSRSHMLEKTEAAVVLNFDIFKANFSLAQDAPAVCVVFRRRGYLWRGLWWPKSAEVVNSSLCALGVYNRYDPLTGSILSIASLDSYHTAHSVSAISSAFATEGGSTSTHAMGVDGLLAVLK